MGGERDSGEVLIDYVEKQRLDEARTPCLNECCDT